MTAYRFTAEEFLFLAQRLGLTHLPRWCPTVCSSSEEALFSSLIQKGFLLSEPAGTPMPHPAIAYLFSLMKAAAVWCCWNERVFLYMAEKRYILVEIDSPWLEIDSPWLETESPGMGRIRLLPIENAASCFAYLEDYPGVVQPQILYDDTIAGADAAAVDLKNRLEAYFEP